MLHSPPVKKDIIFCSRNRAIKKATKLRVFAAFLTTRTSETSGKYYTGCQKRSSAFLGRQQAKTETSFAEILAVAALIVCLTARSLHSFPNLWWYDVKKRVIREAW
jgi:hypothetical protein